MKSEKKTILENRIKAIIRPIVKSILNEDKKRASWKGTMNVRGRQVAFEWVSNDPSLKSHNDIPEGDKYALMAAAKDDIDYAITKQDRTSGELEYSDTYTGQWKLK